MWISALISDATMTSSLNALNFSVTSAAEEKGKWEEWEGVEEHVSTDRGTIKSKEMGGHSEMGEKRDRGMERVIQTLTMVQDDVSSPAFKHTVITTNCERDRFLSEVACTHKRIRLYRRKI